MAGLGGFEVVRDGFEPEAGAMALQLIHRPSGARWLHLERKGGGQDTVLFITIPTPPPDATGVAHVLERCVAAAADRAGRHMPAGMQRVIGDHTVYRAGGATLAAFLHRADACWHSVFYPELDAADLGEDGAMGGVYLGRQARYADAEGLLPTVLAAGLLPDTPFAWDALGDPSVLPDLSPEAVLAFHRAHYRPARSYVVTGGPCPAEGLAPFLSEHLATGDGYRGEPEVVRRAAPWTAARRTEVRYPGGDDGQTLVALRWIAGDASDPDDAAAVEVLARILLGHGGALRRALAAQDGATAVIDAGYAAWGAAGTIGLAVRSGDQQHADRFEGLVFDRLKVIVADGLPAEDVESAMREGLYDRREIAWDFPRMRRRAVDGWRWAGDPYRLLRPAAHLEVLLARWRANPGLFTDMIRTRLLGNPHRLLCVLRPAGRPAYRLLPRRSAADAGALDLAPGGRPPCSPGRWPAPGRAGLPPRQRVVPTSVERIGDRAELVRCDVFSNGINYVNIALDLRGISLEDWGYAPRLVDTLAGAPGEAMARRIHTATGGVRCWLAAPHLYLSLRMVDAQAEESLAVVHDLIFTADPPDLVRLEALTRTALTDTRARLRRDGLLTALAHADRWVDVEQLREAQAGGLAQLRLLRRLVADGDFALVSRRVHAVKQAAAGGPIAVSFCGSDRTCDLVRGALQRWSAQAGGAAAGKNAVALPPRLRRYEGLAGPYPSPRIAVAQPAPAHDHPDSPYLSLGVRLLTQTEIHAKAGAGAGWCAYHWGGSLRWLSESAPAPSALLRIFDESRTSVYQANWTRDQLEQTILAVLTSDPKESAGEPRPEGATRWALYDHLDGRTPASLQARWEAILSATAGRVKSVLIAALEAGADARATCITGARAQLEALQRDLGPAIELLIDSELDDE